MSKNKLSFESENLVVDYISFNIDGYVQITYLRKIASYLFESFSFNATFRRDQLNQREIFFSNDKNSYEVSFRHYDYNPKAKSFWEGTKVDFTGENATYLYSTIKQQKFDWKIFDLTNLTLARIDVNYLRESKIIELFSNFSNWFEKRKLCSFFVSCFLISSSNSNPFLF